MKEKTSLMTVKLKSIMRKYNELLCSNKLVNLKEKFLEWHILLKLTHEEIENL